MSRFKQVPIGSLIVDDRYQRPLDDRRVKRMAENFQDVLFGTLEVSERNGKLAVFDGQHRLAVARALGRDKVPCLVHAKLTPEQEAEAFVRLQRERRGIHRVERFKARLFSGDTDAQAINAIVEGNGYTIRKAGNHAGEESAISAVGSLERVYRRGNLAETLQTLRDLWGGDAKSTDGGLIEGLSIILEGYGHRLEDAAYRLSETPPLVILRRAIGHSGGGASKGEMVAKEIRKAAGLRGRPMKRQVVEPDGN